MINYLDGATLVVVVLILLYAIGSEVLSKLNSSELWFGSELLVGYSIGTLFLSFYTLIPLNMEIFSTIFYLFGLVCVVSRMRKFLLKLPTSISVFRTIVIFSPVFIFLILANLYGENFVVFRGNIWDSFNYNSMAVAYSKYKQSDFEELIKIANPLSYIAKQNLSQRPSVVMLPASILSLISVNSFVIMYFYKALLLSIFASTMIYFLDGIKLKIVSNLLITFAITFSSWIFYIVEIDAFSNLAFIPYIPFLAGHLYKTDNLDEESSFLLFGLILSTNFLIYPEFSSIINCSLVIALIYSMNKFKINQRAVKLRKLLISYSFFSLIIFIYSDQSIVFLFRQVSNGLQNTVDWWGYYGGFILGPDSPVTDPVFVTSLRSDINSGVSLRSKIIILFKDYLMDIIPSLFGLFHVLRWNILIVPANVLSIIILVILFHWLYSSEKKSAWVRLTILCLFIIEILLLFRGNYWSAVKGLSWILLMLPIVICMTFQALKSQYSKTCFCILFFALPFFTVYKYSENNHGIGVHDGFPSILKKSSKTEQAWSFNYERFRGCSNILVQNNDSFKRHFYFLNLENKSLKYSTNYSFMQSYGAGKIISIPEVQFNYDCTIE